MHRPRTLRVRSLDSSSKRLLGVLLVVAVSIKAGRADQHNSVAIADSSAPISAVGAATVQLVALSAGKKIVVTSWSVTASVAGTFKFVYGTGSLCATGLTSLTGAMNLPANGFASSPGTPSPQFTAPAGNALCITGTGTSQSLNGYVSYTQY